MGWGLGHPGGGLHRRKMLQRLLLRPRVVVPSVALVGAGAWLSADKSREARCRAHAQAAGRAVRLAWVGTQIVLDYRSAREWANEEPAELEALKRRHEELQREAGRAERARAAAVKRGGPEVAEAAEWARRSRKEAAELGEEIALKRVTHHQTSGLHLRWEALHLRCAERLLALCHDNGGVYVKLGQHLAQLDYLVPEPFTRVLGALFEHNKQSDWNSVATLVEADLGAPLAELFESIEPTPIASASLAQAREGAV